MKSPSLGCRYPVAAYIVSQLFVRALLAVITGREEKSFPFTARLTESVPSNHGRAEYMAVALEQDAEKYNGAPDPQQSGLITSLARSDGYICIRGIARACRKGSRIRYAVGLPDG
jgi:molybdopterin biosynthesis enzyme